MRGIKGAGQPVTVGGMFIGCMRPRKWKHWDIRKTQVGGQQTQVRNLRHIVQVVYLSKIYSQLLGISLFICKIGIFSCGHCQNYRKFIVNYLSSCSIRDRCYNLSIIVPSSNWKLHGPPIPLVSEASWIVYMPDVSSS